MTTHVELSIKGDIEVLRLQPGDVIVVNLRNASLAKAEHLEEVRAALMSRFPGHEVIFTNGATVTVQRSEP